MAPIDVTGAEAVARRLQRIADDAPAAEAKAVNTAGRAVGRAALRALSADTGLGVGRIQAMRGKGVRATVATPAEPVYTLSIGPRALQVASLRARETSTGVTYRLRGQRALPGAFIVDRLRRGRGVALRAGRQRLPIARQFAPETLADLAEGHLPTLVPFATLELERALGAEMGTVVVRSEAG